MPIELGGQVNLAARVVRIGSEGVTIQLADGQAVLMSAEFIGSPDGTELEHKAVAGATKKVIRGKERIPD